MSFPSSTHTEANYLRAPCLRFALSVAKCFSPPLLGIHCHLPIVNHRRSLWISHRTVLEIARLWPHLMRDVPMRDVPALVVRTDNVRTRERTRKLRKRCHTPACFSLFPFCFLSLVLSPSSFLSLLALLLPQVLPFVQLNTINDLNLRSIQTLCLHLSYSTPLRKTQTVNHYFRIEYFQHPPQ